MKVDDSKERTLFTNSIKINSRAFPLFTDGCFRCFFVFRGKLFSFRIENAFSMEMFLILQMRRGGSRLRIEQAKSFNV